MEMLELENCCNIHKGRTAIKWAEPGSYPLITTAEFSVTNKTFDFDGKAVCIPLISSTGHGHASIKRLHYHEGKFALASIMCAIFSKDESKLISEYIFVYLTLCKDDLLVSLMRGSANVSLTISDLKKVKIPIPDVSVQKGLIELYRKQSRFHNKLDGLFSEQEKHLNKLESAMLYEAYKKSDSNVITDSTIETLKDITHDSKQVIPASVDQIVKEKGPYQLPKGWYWCRLGYISEKIGAGSTPKGGSTTYLTHGIPFLRSQNIFNNTVDLSDVAFISKNVDEKMKGSRVYPEDVLINITGASIGRTAVYKYTEPANVNQHVAIIRLIDKKMAKFVQLYLCSPIFQYQIQEVQTGISREGLSMRELQQLQVPVCSRQEQEKIVGQVEAFYSYKTLLTEAFWSTIKEAENLFEINVTNYFVEKLELTEVSLSSPFLFSAFAGFQKEKQMPRKEKKIRGNLHVADIETLQNHFGSKPFTFNEIYELTDIEYDLLKDEIFGHLDKSTGKSGLKIEFDEESKMMHFKIL